MDGKQLKNSILQWAIQGKLVPQNPKDEPAQKLLERIAQSRHSECSEESSKGSKKSSLRGAKATKQSKALSSRIYRENGVWYEQVGNAEPKDISDKIPFEIPENWAWCRLKNLARFLNGDRSKNYPNKSEYVSNGVAWINTGHITPAGYLSTETMNFISEEKFNSLGSGFIASGDLVYCLRGATYGKIARVEPYDRGAIASSLMIIRPVVIDVREYIFLLLRTPYAKEQLNIYANGAAQPNLAAKDIEKYFVPLPPLAEQKRIVAKLEQVLPLAEEYGAAQEQLDKLNKELPEALKKSILQQAIQGKLVPQNPKDEPAQKLLERIASSRHSEQSEESSKRSKKTTKNPISRIYCENGTWYEQIGNAEPKDISDEIPFDIPAGWAWCRLKKVCCDFIVPQRDKPTKFNGCIPWCRIEDIEGKFLNGSKSNQLVTKELADSMNMHLCPKGTVICACSASIGNQAITTVDCYTNQTFIGVVCEKEALYNEYLYYFMMSQKQNLKDLAKGTTIGYISRKKFEEYIFPLPPLAEQKRIVTKLEQLFKTL